MLHALTLPLKSIAYGKGLQPPKISRLDGQLRSLSVSVAFGVQVTMEGVRKRKIGCHPDRSSPVKIRASGSELGQGASVSRGAGLGRSIRIDPIRVTLISTRYLRQVQLQ